MKKIISIIIALSIMLTGLVGCSTKGAVSNENKGKHTVVDNIGNTVTLPDEINRIVIMSLPPLPSIYCMITGSTDKLVGMTPMAKNAAVNSLLLKAFPKLKDVPSDFAQGSSINVEELMKLKPDVVFYNTESEVDKQAVQKLTVPAVGFSTLIAKDNNTIESFSAWAKLMGEVLGIEDRASKIVEYGKKVQADVAERVSKVPTAERKRTLILTNYNQTAITAAGSTFGKFWCSAIGADDVSLEIKTATAPVNLEQIYKWNPDVIFLNSFSSFTPEDLYNNTAIEGHDWSSIKAIQDKRVYKYPLGIYYWFPPSSDSPLSLMWMAKSLYPELFKDIDLDKTIKDYYDKFYGIKLTDDELKTIYNPTKESAVK